MWLSVSPRQLLHHECPRCPELPPFSLFGDLEQHMRKQHELFCCKLCLKHLKVCPYPQQYPPNGLRDPGSPGWRWMVAKPYGAWAQPNSCERLVAASAPRQARPLKPPSIPRLSCIIEP